MISRAAAGKVAPKRPPILAVRIVPDIGGHIEHDGVRRAADNHPPDRRIDRWIRFHVQQKGRNVQEITGPRDARKLAVFSPAQMTDALQHIGDGLLRSVMVDIDAAAGRDRKKTAP